MTLKEEIHYLRGQIQAPQPPQHNIAENNPEYATVARHNASIFNRIRQAEAASAKPELTEQRRKEYEERINQILKPEMEVLE